MTDKIPYLKRELWDDDYRARTEEALKEQKHWTQRKNRVVPVFLILNVLVFLGWQFFTGGYSGRAFFYNNFLVSPVHVTSGNWWTLLTSVFSHNQSWHLIFNMMVLMSFGGLLEKFFGIGTFLKLYIGAGLYASVMHCLTSAFLMDNMGANALGASGALTALLMVFALIWPKHKILVFGLIPVPALPAMLVFVSLDVWGLIAQTRGGGLPIGHSAHLGGSIFGFVYYQLFLRRRVVRQEQEA